MICSPALGRLLLSERDGVVLQVRAQGPRHDSIFSVIQLEDELFLVRIDADNMWIDKIPTTNGHVGVAGELDAQVQASIRGILDEMARLDLMPDLSKAIGGWPQAVTAWNLKVWEDGRCPR